MASNQIFLVMDEGRPVTAFTSKRELAGFLRSRFWLVGNPLIYKFAGNGYAPVIMTMSAALVEGAMHLARALRASPFAVEKTRPQGAR